MEPVSKPVPFVPTPWNVVERMLEMAGLEEGETVYDLGCGDGRFLLTAARKFKASAVGCELRPALVSHVRKRVKELRLDDMVSVVKRNMFTIPLQNADVITLYLTRDLLAKLRPKLETELKPTARIVCHDFPIPGWTPTDWQKIEGHFIYLYEKRRKLV